MNMYFQDFSINYELELDWTILTHTHAFHVIHWDSGSGGVLWDVVLLEGEPRIHS